MRFISSFFLAILIITLTASTDKATTDYPQDYFRAPTDETMLLSGTFGELRPNHFHAGIDIKGKVGQPLYAVADGYISRIKIQEGGYGKVLYLRHPNGYTSVYAHIDKYDSNIEKFVKEAQYQKKSYEIELYPTATQFVFKKGQVLAKMGVTGRSYGPHLHFEIRSTATEKPINPLLFGLKVADNQAPRMHQVKIYSLNDKRETINTKTLDVVKKGSGYGIKGDTISIGAWRAGFALKVYDHMNGVTNWNGIYALKMYEDDVLVYDFDMETFGFDETRYINAHLDYEEQTTKDAYFNRCYALPGNHLSIYNEQKEKGVVKLKSAKASKIKMVAEDAKGNKSEFVFWVKRSEVQPPTKTPTYSYILPYNEESVIENRSLKLYFPKGTLYENLYLQYQSSFDESYNIYSSVHHIHDATVPVHKYFDISLRPTFMPEELKSKAFIAYCGKDNSVKNCGGQWKGDMLNTKVRDLGDYCIMVDNVPPKITPISFKSDLKGASKMTFKIKDNVETDGQLDGLKYRATLDGQWILLEYDEKNNLLTHYFDDHLNAGQHQLQLVVTDNRGNETIYERTFTR